MNDNLTQLKEELQKAQAALSAHPDNDWDRTSALWAGGIFLIFVVLLFVLMAWLIQRGSSPNSLLRVFTVPLVCVMAVFLILIGYTQEQISPVIGLLGTVVGYLLGKGDTKEK